MRVLAVGAHPDDIEILCGGTLAKYAKRGDEVVMAVLTDGAAGHIEILPDELREIRRAESEASAAVIGAELIWVGLPDEFLLVNEDTRLKVVEMIRQAKPDVILTHFPDDYHPDHRAASSEVFDASFVASLKNVETATPFHPIVPPLFYFDTLAAQRFLPTEYVDVGDTYDVKIEMLRKHESQLKWLKDHDNIDIIDFVDVVARLRGLQCGCKYAEGFRAQYAWPRAQPLRLLP